jgi:hypothetical protein
MSTKIHTATALLVTTLTVALAMVSAGTAAAWNIGGQHRDNDSDENNGPDEARRQPLDCNDPGSASAPGPWVVRRHVKRRAEARSTESRRRRRSRLAEHEAGNEPDEERKLAARVDVTGPSDGDARIRVARLSSAAQEGRPLGTRARAQSSDVLTFPPHRHHS